MRTFQLQTLLDASKSTKGPMSPVLAANEMAKQKLIPPYTKLYRIRTKEDGYSDGEINQVYEGPRKTGLTGHDQLMTLSPIGGGHYCVAIFLDRGVNLLPICMWFSDQSLDELVITQLYQNAKFEKKFTPVDLKVLCEIATTPKPEPQKS